VFSTYLSAYFSPFGSPDPKVGPARGLDRQIQTERMGYMRLPLVGRQLGLTYGRVA